MTLLFKIRQTLVKKYQIYFISLRLILKCKLIPFELNINIAFDVIQFFNLTKSRFSYFFC